MPTSKQLNDLKIIKMPQDVFNVMGNVNSDGLHIVTKDDNETNLEIYSRQRTDELLANAIVVPELSWVKGTLPSNLQWEDVAYNGTNRMVAVAESGETAYSSDGKTWTNGGKINLTSLDRVVYGNGVFVAMASGGINGHVAYSTNGGISWSVATDSLGNARTTAIIFAFNRFIVLANNNLGMFSSNGSSWTTMNLPLSPNNGWAGVALNNGRLVAVAAGENNTIVSTNGTSWTLNAINVVAASTTDQWSSIAAGNGRFIIIAEDNTANQYLYSTDGLVWSLRNFPYSGPWASVCYGDTMFIAVRRDSSNIVYSNNGLTWTTMSLAESAYWGMVTFCKDKFILLSDGSRDGYYYLTINPGVSTTNASDATIALAAVMTQNITPALTCDNTAPLVVATTDGLKTTDIVPEKIATIESVEHVVENVVSEKIDEVKSKSLNIVLEASKWEGNTYTIADESITANCDGMLNLANNITTEQYEAAANASMRISSQTNGSLVITADGTVPTIDIPVNLLILCVSGSTGGGSNVSLDSPAFTGIPTAPTAEVGTNTDQIATTAFVQAAINSADTTTVELVLYANAWVGDSAPYTQTINHKLITPDCDGMVTFSSDITDEELAIGRSAQIRLTDQGNGTATITASGELPTVDLPISLMLFGISGNGGSGGGASLESPEFTGTPTAPTAPAGTSTTQIATTEFVQNAINDAETITLDLVLSANSWNGTEAPYTQTINNELITSDCDGMISFSTTITDEELEVASAGKIRLTEQGDGFITVTASGDLPTIDLPITLMLFGVSGSGGASLESPAFTGTPTAPTATKGTNTDQLATTAFVQNAVSECKSTVLNFTLSASAWSNNSQTISNENITASGNGFIVYTTGISSEAIAAASDSQITLSAQVDGSITISTNGTTPTVDIPITLIILP